MNKPLSPILPGELNIARNIARRSAGKWSLVDPEDLESELILWLFENLNVVFRYRTEPDGQMKLITALRRKAHGFCMAEQQERSGSTLDAGSRYSMQQIERSLVAMFNSTGSNTRRVHPQTGELLDSYDPVLDDARTMVLDVKIAFSNLPVEYQKILIWKFEQEFTYRDIAMLEKISAPGARKRVKKAVKLLQIALNK
jgi:DNA-directed RNA polymerase specialized sigma24 family protein